MWEKDQEIDALKKLCTATHLAVQPSVTQWPDESDVTGVTLPTCQTLSSFLPIVCETPAEVTFSQGAQRSVPTLSQLVCSSQVQPASQLFVKPETQRCPSTWSHGKTVTQANVVHVRSPCSIADV